MLVSPSFVAFATGHLALVWMNVEVTHAPVSLYKAQSDFGAQIQNERSQPEREFRNKKQLGAETSISNIAFFDTWSRTKQTDMLIISTSKNARLRNMHTSNILLRNPATSTLASPTSATPTPAVLERNDVQATCTRQAHHGRYQRAGLHVQLEEMSERLMRTVKHEPLPCLFKRMAISGREVDDHGDGQANVWTPQH